MNVGDAILTFRGDLTQLNLAFDETAASAAKLAPAQATVDQLGEAMQSTAADAANLGAAMKEAGTVGETSGAQVTTAWQKVAQATVANMQAQRELAAAMYAVKATSGESAQAVDALAGAQEKAAITAAALAEARRLAVVETERATLAEKDLGAATILTSEEIAAGAATTEASMHKSKESLELVGDAIGVRIPKGIRGMITELPGVGAALEAAFSGIAIFVIIQLIVEATEKLTELISTTFIYTEANKKAYESAVELNKAIAEQQEKIKALKEAYDLIGLTGAAKTAAEIEQLNKAWTENETAIANATNTLARYRDQQRESASFRAEDPNRVTEEQANAATKAYALALGSREIFNEQFKALAKRGNEELLQESIAHGEASIAAESTIGKARIDLLKAQSNLELAMVRNSYFERGQAAAGFVEQQYQLDRQIINEKIANASRDPANADKVKALYAEREALDKQHATTIYNTTADLFNKVAELQAKAKPITLFDDGKVELPDNLKEAGKALAALDEGLKTLGIQGSSTFSQQVIDARDAYQKIKSSGLATYTDLLQAQQKLALAEAGAAAAQGNASAAARFRKEADDMEKELIRLGVVVDKHVEKIAKMGLGYNTVATAMDRFAQKLADQRGELTESQQTFDSVIGSVSQIFGNAVTAWVSGQESLGKALKESLAQEAAMIAGKAAMYSLYYFAHGIADLFWHTGRAAADFAAAAEFAGLAVLAGGVAHSMRPSKEGVGNTAENQNAQPIETSAAEQPESETLQTTNVMRFAKGALVHGPTLAIIGDAANAASAANTGMQREAAIPLDDPRATKAIADAFLRHMPPPKVDVHVHGKSIGHLIREISTAVDKGGHTLVSSTARSQRRKS